MQSISERLQIEIKKLDLLYHQSYAAMVAVLVTAYFYVYVAWDKIPHSYLLGWLAVVNAFAICRLTIIPYWKKAKDQIQDLPHLRMWKAPIYVLLLISGCCWGFIGLLAPSAGPTVQVLTALFVSAMSAGGVILYVSLRRAMACVVAPTMAGWGVGYVLSGQDFHLLVGIVILIYGGLMVVLGKQLHASLSTIFSLDNVLQRNEERVRLVMKSSDAKTWDWDLRDDSMYCDGNVGLIQGHAHLKEMLRGFLKTETDLDAEMNVAPVGAPPKYLAFRGKIYRDAAGKAYRCTGIVWDITLKKTEEILRRDRDLYEASNNAKSVLLANASHEIRTPLAAILGFAESLLVKGHLDNEVRSEVHAIHRQGKFMTALVNDLLDLSKIESNKLYIQKAPMSPALEIEDSISALRSVLGPKHKITISYESLVPQEIQMDPVRFRQILNNLLSNAIKFTPEGEIQVKVSFYSDVRGAATLAVQVRDVGIGMDLDTQNNLFQPFVRGEAEYVQKVSGSGLGLALSQRLALLLDGKISLVSSELGQGSVFEFSLDVGALSDLKLREVPKELNKGDDVPAVVIEKKLSILSGRRVLVVDDSEDLRLLMNRYLTRQGALIESCDNGANAVDMALNAHTPFDLILMDIKMPVMDGYEAVAKLRGQGYSHPIIAVTAQASTEGKAQCLQAGFDGYLSKPIDMSVLEEILFSTVQRV